MVIILHNFSASIVDTVFMLSHTSNVIHTSRGVTQEDNSIIIIIVLFMYTGYVVVGYDRMTLGLLQPGTSIILIVKDCLNRSESSFSNY